MADSKLRLLERKQSEDVVLFCEAQGFPVPAFSPRIPCTFIQVNYIFFISHEIVSFPAEPVGVKAPVFSSDNLINAFNRISGHGFALLCQAQGLPVPIFRLGEVLGSFYFAQPKQCLSLCSGETMEDILFDFICVEPIGLKPPTFSSLSKSFTYVSKEKQGFVLLCPAQGLPTPMFSASPTHSQVQVSFCSSAISSMLIRFQNLLGRKLLHFHLILRFQVLIEKAGKALPCCAQPKRNLFHYSEPTNNIPPKSLDKKIGYTLIVGNITEMIFLMCPVVAYPVPLFRYKYYVLIDITIRYRANEQCISKKKPTNNVAPKKDGEVFQGWKVLNVPKGESAWFTCQVTGYPVPRYM
ncbi:hypothetical protein WA026_008556 [Henosepilachna vigintioctopunctata]|uniref:Uncharacterized protein n=1 Tax=Henosepilachna vigintioctopunctata TaxID=420089 RepID=A0AAW1UBY3_9CUCU